VVAILLSDHDCDLRSIPELAPKALIMHPRTSASIGVVSSPATLR